VIVCDEVVAWAEKTPPLGAHALLCDPPYSLGNGKRGFMNAAWDNNISFRPDTWKALAQHLLPGAFGACFASSRGWHRLACAIEDAGLIIHPSIFMLGWVQGTGWPKSTKIDTQVDKAAGVEQETVLYDRYRDGRLRTVQRDQSMFSTVRNHGNIGKLPATPLATVWAGHRYGGQMLKPALEPIIIWQKPYACCPVDSITQTGAGALWIEGCRISPSGHREGAVGDYTHASMPYIQASVGGGAAVRHALVCTLRIIGDILRCRSTDDTCRGHNGHDQDGMWMDAEGCASIHARLYPNGVWCGLHAYTTLSSQVDCLPCRHFCDGHLQKVQEAAQVSAPSLADALEHICYVLREPSHTPWKCTVHPSSLDGPVLQVFSSLLALLSNIDIDTIIPYRERHYSNESIPGRWPANLTLIHHDACELVGTRQVQGSHDGASRNAAQSAFRFIACGPGNQGIKPVYTAPDDTETVPAWRCHPSCLVASLDAQAGNHKAGGAKDCRGEHHGYGSPRPSVRDQTYESYGDSGPASRFFPTFGWADEVAEQLAAAHPAFYCSKASQAERNAGLTERNPHNTIKPQALLRWLATLLLPPAAYAPRRLLVPFAGVGSEITAATEVGWEEVVGVEQDATYVALAEERLVARLGLFANYTKGQDRG
jgi:hypothetical protein